MNVRIRRTTGRPACGHRATGRLALRLVRQQWTHSVGARGLSPRCSTGANLRAPRRAFLKTRLFPFVSLQVRETLLCAFYIYFAARQLGHSFKLICLD